jgi:hypothetical protein
MLIYEKGLFEGRRLRRCSPLARLYWPYFFALSNGYLRIELDYNLLEERMFTLRDYAPSAKAIEGFFDEYRENHLIFIYGMNDQLWGQWDSRCKDAKDYKSKIDERSPHPNDGEYVAWLIEQHFDDWAAYHWNRDINKAEWFSESFTKVLENLSKIHAGILPLVKVVGSGVGQGVGQRLIHTTVQSTSIINQRTSQPSAVPSRENSQSSIERPSAATEPLDDSELRSCVQDMVAEYPRELGPKETEQSRVNLFEAGIKEAADNRFNGDLRAALNHVERAFSRFIKVSVKRKPRFIYGVEKFFSKWVAETSEEFNGSSAAEVSKEMVQFLETEDDDL